MDKIKRKIGGVKVFFKTDWNIVRAKRLVTRGVRAAPHGAARYLLNKVPVAGWITAYNYRWLPADMVSGVTVGVVLVLQAVNLAVPIPGGISVQQTLLASWLPGFLYAIMGTSKNISVGPTAASIVLSLQIVAGVSAAARIPPQIILPALTLAVSIWFLIFGALGLGFIFDLIPVFMCIAVVTALSIIVTTLQLPILLGLLGIPNDFLAVIPATIATISNVSGRTIAISVSGLVFLGVLTKLKTLWGKEKSTRGRIARIGVASGALFIIILFATVSSFYLRDLPLQQQVAPFVPPGAGHSSPAQGAHGNGTAAVAMINPALHGSPARRLRRQGPVAHAPPSARAEHPKLPTLPFWAAFPEFTTPIPAARPPVLQLFKGLFFPSFILFFAVNLEHIIVARFFAHQHGYTVSKSQEMFSLGVINLVNSFWGGVPVGGGDMARSSILGYTGVKSPLSQIFTSATVLVGMLPLSGALRFVPQATLSAVIMIAVVDQMPPQALMTTYFKLSFADFIAFFLVMNATIPVPGGVNAVVGSAIGVIFLMVYHLFRIMFKKPKVMQSEDLETLYNSRYENSWIDGDVIPQCTLVMKPDGDIIFSNSERMRRHILDAAYLNNSGKAGEVGDESERTWDNPLESYINSVRKRNGAADSESVAVFRPRLRMVILDMTSSTFIDSSALMSLELLKKQMRDWAGETLEFRFVGLNKHLKRRFQRAGWHIVDPFGPQVSYVEEDDEIRDFIFESLPQAIRYTSQDAAMHGSFEDVMGRANYKMDKTKSYD
ncbi:unnamed protein product [Discula destructiva]